VGTHELVTARTSAGSRYWERDGALPLIGSSSSANKLAPAGVSCLSNHPSGLERPLTLWKFAVFRARRWNGGFRGASLSRLSKLAASSGMTSMM